MFWSFGARFPHRALVWSTFMSVEIVKTMTIWWKLFSFISAFSITSIFLCPRTEISLKSKSYLNCSLTCHNSWLIDSMDNKPEGVDIRLNKLLANLFNKWSFVNLLLLFVSTRLQNFNNVMLLLTWVSEFDTNLFNKTLYSDCQRRFNTAIKAVPFPCMEALGVVQCSRYSGSNEHEYFCKTRIS